jgi:type IV pilus assembly protein PilV
MNMAKRDLQEIKSIRQGGFTLLEVIVAISILMVGLLAVGTMQVSAIYGNSFAGRMTSATSIAEDKMEQLLSLQYTYTGTHPDLLAGTYPDPPVTDASGYTLTWTVVNDNPIANTKQITVTVTWRDKLVNKSTSLSSYLTIS